MSFYGLVIAPLEIDPLLGSELDGILLVKWLPLLPIRHVSNPNKIASDSLKSTSIDVINPTFQVMFELVMEGLVLIKTMDLVRFFYPSPLYKTTNLKKFSMTMYVRGLKSILILHYIHCMLE